MSIREPSRREVVMVIGAVMSSLAARPVLASPRPRLRPNGPHPDPRPGIDASRVLTAKEVHDPEVLAIYDQVREIPHVVDGIRCHCGCASWEGFYSLLTCYEENGMAQACLICQGQAKLVYRLHKDGWSLNGIRASVDAAYSESR